MEIIKIRERGELAASAAAWYSSKWKIPLAAYEESIARCLEGKGAVPQWYIAAADGKIIGGAGVIDNDFHNRRELTPNVCALYVEQEYRRRGIAGQLLDYICRDMISFGIGTLYLVTDHTSFYERYGWDFLCMVSNNGEDTLSRMYVHRQ